MSLTELTGTEGLSMPFSFELTLLSETHNIDFQKIIGENVTLSITLADGENRYFNGIISRFSQGRGGGEKGGDPRYSHYRATLVPWFWLLSRYANSRIFQDLSVPEIVERVFNDRGWFDYKIRLDKEYQKRTYCVQYRETDFNFISRLLEEEGIYYFFEHEEKKHTLALADAPDKHLPCPNQEEARYQLTEGGWLEGDVITSLEKMQEIRSGKYTLRDFNFETPDTSLEVNAPSQYRLGPGEREVYDYPGIYGTRSEGDRLVNLRMEEEEASITTMMGSSVCRAFTGGYRFKLNNHYRDDMTDKEYVLTYIDHEASEGSGFPGMVASEREPEFSYINHFSCIPFDVPFRPSRRAPKPFVRGPQTAIVVGPRGEESYTDENPYGMIKVQFHWDREGKKDEKSTCWLRVAYPYAGEKHGMQFTPLIGDEVLVDFLEGDPDKPIVSGSFFKGDHKSLIQPKEMIKNEILTPYQHRLRLDDKEKNITLNTGQNVSIHMGDDDKTDDRKNIKLTIEKDFHYIVLKEEPGHKSIYLTCDHTICVRSSGSQSDISISTEKNNLAVHLDDLSNSITLSGNTFSITLDGNSGSINIESKVGTIDLKTPGMINIDGAGGVKITGGGPVQVTAPNVQLNAGMVQASGVIQCATLITNAVVSTSYTPGAGNIL